MKSFNIFVLIFVHFVSMCLSFEFAADKFNKQSENITNIIQRVRNYVETEKQIQILNQRRRVGYTLGHNQFSTVSQADYALYKGLDYNDNITLDLIPKEKSRQLERRLRLPKHVDWVEEGWDTPIRDQGRCGCCYAFSATAALEAQIWLETGRKTVLSTQELVDCSHKQGNKGCNGGLPIRSFFYAYFNGLRKEKLYPYDDQESTCKSSNHRSDDFELKDYKMAIKGNDESLMRLVAFDGPVTVAIDSSAFDFQFYKRGIYSGCGKKVDHSVLLVGYGERSGQKYWRIKNQWSEEWGMKGYMDISRDTPNNCGISTMAVVPKLNTRKHY